MLREAVAAVLGAVALGVAADAAAADHFVTPTGTGAACTQASPCALTTAVAAVGAGDTVYVAAGTYTGSGPEVVAITTSLSLLGGWDGAATGAIVRSPKAHVSTLDGENARRVVAVTGAITATVDGFVITRGNASGLVTDCDDPAGAPDGCGGGIFVYQAAATIANNRIAANTAATASLGAPNGGTGYGGGIYVGGADGVVIRGNVIADNVGSTADTGMGGGIAVVYSGPGVLVEGNEVSTNTATTVAKSAWGGGIAFASSEGTVRDNVISANVGSTVGWSQGGGLYGWISTLTVESNLLIANGGVESVYLGYFAGAISRNRFIANRSETVLTIELGRTAPVTLDGNILVHGHSMGGWCVRLDASPSDPLAVTARHNTIAGNGYGIGISVGGDTTAAFTNTIVADLWKGAETDDPGASLTLERTLFWWNRQDGVRGTDPYDGNPSFVNPLANDFHLLPGSAATDIGAATPLAVDIDGEERSLGAAPDLGADELAPRRFDFGTDASSLEPGFTRVTATTTTSSSPSYGWSAGSVGARSRGGGTALTRDFNFSRDATFSVALPAGVYDVKLWLGDTGFAHDLMAILVEGAAVDTVSTAAGEVVTRTFRTVVLDGRLDVRLKDTGGSDANAVINALEITAVGFWKLDFGTAGSPVAPNYTRITHATTYTPVLGAGWLSGVVASRDRGTASPLTRDLNLTREARFAFDIPSDDYIVRGTLGDASYAHDEMGFYLFDGTYGNEHSTTAGEFVTLGYRINHIGQQHVLKLKDMGGIDPNAVINALDVEPRPRLRFDFGTAASPLAPRYTRVTPASAYTPVAGFGWIAGTIDARSRPGTDPLTRDFNFTRDGTFAVDVPDGRYDIAVTAGDATTAHDQIEIWLEGTLVETLDSVAAGAFVTRTFYYVQVSGGQLTLRIEDRGGTDVNAVINALEVW